MSEFIEYHELYNYDSWVSEGIISSKDKNLLDELLDEDEYNRKEASTIIKEKKDEVYKKLSPKDKLLVEFPIYTCSECGEDTFIENEESSTGYKCEFCGSENSDYEPVKCEFCEAIWPSFEMRNEEDWYEDGSVIEICPDCWSKFYN